MSYQTEQPSTPRAVIHKQILDAAADWPDAAMGAIASDIPMATTDLVERVLDEYGDPAADQSTDPLESEPPPMAEERTPVDLDDFSGMQRETLRAIMEHPDATLSEIGDALGVSAPTVSNRVNDIEGFDWTDRQTFVETLFETRGPTMQEETTEPMASNGTGTETTTTQLAERIETLEQEVEDLYDIDEPESVLDDPDLVHKVLHACLKADNITEKEELQILKMLHR